jgi:hypothetical protein
MKHTWHSCFEDGCFICNGGLADCTVCGGAEAALTTECCGEKLPVNILDSVQANELDFIGGHWVEKVRG